MSSITEKYYQLKDYSLMTVKGERSYEFIQGQVSCDINLEQEKINGLFCDEKGYVITNPTLFLEEDIKFMAWFDDWKLRNSRVKSSKRHAKSDKLNEQGKQLSSMFGINEGEIEDIFDVIAKEHPDL